MALYIQLSTQNVLTKFLSVSSITGGNSVNTEQLASTVASLLTTSVVPPAISTQAVFTSSLSSGTIQAGIMSTLVLYASSIVGVTTGGGLTNIPSSLSTFAMFTSSLTTSTLTGVSLSSQQLFVSSIQANTLSADTAIATSLFVSSGLISTLSTNALNFAGGFGYLTMPDIFPNTVFTSTVTTSNLLVGVNATVSPIQFFGFGTYSNSVLAELSTGATTQELLMFRGSNATDRIRFQTTGSLVFEAGVSSRLWPTVPSNATPAMVINTSSNVGIQTASPGATLDVAGSIRGQLVSTQALNVSSINGQGYWAPQLSTVLGLGTAGYLSSFSLISTTQGLESYISSFIDPTELASTVVAIGSNQLVSTFGLDSSLRSTVEGLGTAGYISTPGGGGGGLTTGQLTSTVVGLGTVGYLSSIPAILSTTALFTSSLAASSITGLTVSTLALNASTATVAVGTISSVTTNSLTVGASQGWILTSPLQTVAVSTNTLWADVANITTGNITTGIISTVTTTNLQIGTGSSWILTSPIQTAIMSTTYSFADQAYVNTLNVGTLSTVNSIQYAGLFNQYNNTVLAEVSTGAGTQEFLVFKGSSASDRIRMQTTGTFVIETGVSARLWNSNTTQTLSNATPAFVINTSSNVGIQTASPGATLDVAGTGRFQTLSSLALFASSIVAPSVFAAQFFTF